MEREWGNLMDLSRYIPSKIGDEAFAGWDYQPCRKDRERRQAINP